MSHTATRLSVIGRLCILVCVSFVMTSCGFHLQGQSHAALPTHLSLFVDDPVLESVIKQDLVEGDVDLAMVESVAQADSTVPFLQLTRTLKHRAELILDNNGDVLIWRYTLSSHYLYGLQGGENNTTTKLETSASQPISVTTDVDLSGTQATVNERIEADSWAMLYQQLGARITRQLSFE